MDEAELEHLVETTARVAVPEAWRTFPDGTVQPDWALLVRESRDSH